MGALLLLLLLPRLVTTPKYFSERNFFYLETIFPQILLKTTILQDIINLGISLVTIGRQDISENDSDTVKMSPLVTSGLTYWWVGWVLQ